MSPRHSSWCCTCGLAVGMMLTVDAGADEVASAGKPVATGVQVVALSGGELIYRLPAGREVSRPIPQVTYLQIGDWRLFNQAERQQRDGDLRSAIASYERLLETPADEPSPGGDARRPGADRLDRRLLAQCRLLRACDAEGRFDRAVAVYLEVIEAMPEALTALRPAAPRTAGSRFVAAALPLVASAIDRHGDDAVARALSAWRAEWPGATPTTAEAVSPPRPFAESPADRRMRIVLAAISSSVEAGDTTAALDRIGPLQNASAGAHRPALYYWQGRALADRSEHPDAPDARRDRARAGLAFMRVVIHFPGSEPAAECLFRAAELCMQDGQPEAARRLWTELLASYPAAGTWPDRASEALRRLQETR